MQISNTFELSRARVSNERRREPTVARLRALLRKVDAKILQADPSFRYNYVVLRQLLRDVLDHLLEKRKLSTRSTYILPGALWIVKSLLNRKMTVEQAAETIATTRYLARRMFRELVDSKNLELLIPTNLSPKDIKIFTWVDKVGCDEEGNPLYTLTLYFSFPFDISELDRRSEYEPVSFLFVKKGNKYIPIKAYVRVHYDLYVYDIENLDTVRILFMRYGHTPKILGAKEIARVSDSNIFKEALDKLWLYIGDAITRVAGVRRLRLKDESKKVHVYVNYKLPKTANNPFLTAVHPFFCPVEI